MAKPTAQLTPKSAKHESLSRDAEIDPVLADAFRRLFDFGQYERPTIEALLAKPPFVEARHPQSRPPTRRKAAKSKAPKSKPLKSKPPKSKSPPRGTLERSVFDRMKKNRPHKGDRKYSTNTWDALDRPGSKKTVQNYVSKYRKRFELPKRF